VNATVNDVYKYTFELSKYDPPNNVWTDKDYPGFFCVCPTNPPDDSITVPNSHLLGTTVDAALYSGK